MILLLAVACGLAAGMLRARLQQRPYRIAQLEAIELVVLGVVPQLVAFHIPGTAARFPEALVPPLLLISQLLLLAFVWLNRRRPGFWLLGSGVLCNLLVIALNGGWMPIAPQTVAQIALAPQQWQAGERFGLSKDRVMPAEEIRLAFLSDHLVLPWWRVAFSPGDVLLAAGVFYLLWAHGGAQEDIKEV